MIGKSNCQLEDHPLPAIHYQNSSPPPYLKSALSLCAETNQTQLQINVWSLREISTVQPREPESSSTFRLSSHSDYCISSKKLEFSDTIFESELLYERWNTANQFVFAPSFLWFMPRSPLHRNRTLAVSPCVTSSLTRGWSCLS
jgi:hypothetical protein